MNDWSNLLEEEMIKRIQKNGYVSVPKKYREQLTSDEVKVYVTELNGKKVVVLEPVKEDKKPLVIYK